MGADSGSSNRSFSSYLVLTVKGFCMGSADVVPGVSGGTMAFILGIYEELIRALRSFDGFFVRSLFSFRLMEALEHVSWKFLISVAAGIFAAIFSLARLLSYLLENHPAMIWSFFFGLVLASIYTVARRIERWSISRPICLFAGAGGAYLLVGMVPVSTPDAPWFLFLCGAVAICAMILPGISGAFILVLLGKYHYILEAVNQRDFLTLLVVASGAAVGLLSFARLLNYLFKRSRDLTIAVLSGLMLGSLRKVWPWKETLQTAGPGELGRTTVYQVNTLPDQWDPEVTAALFLMLAGLAAVLFINTWAERKGGDHGNSPQGVGS